MLSGAGVPPTHETEPGRSAFRADLIVADSRVHAGASLVVERGIVAGIGPPPEGVEVLDLSGKAILPGLVNAHSHAFQRAIRGRTEYRAGPSNFWAWREAMYAAAERLSPEDLFAVSRMCFLEMALSGITTVGEFHYLHRDAFGRPYDDPNELEKTVVRAARDVGLRVVLLRVAYARAGYRITENPTQRRFVETSPEEFLSHLMRLESDLAADPLATIGAALHSVRACPKEWLETIAHEAHARRWPIHAHVSEQPLEIEQCRAEHGVTPPVLLHEVGALGPATTAVHAIHLTEDDVRALGGARATVCACPTTERNLGDGIVPAKRLLDAGARLAVGTDSAIQIDLLEDARSLDYHLRLMEMRRAPLAPESGGRGALGRALYGVASEGGMRSLGIPGGLLRPGDPADFIVVDLADPSIAGATEDALFDTIVFSMSRAAVRQVYVAGRAIVDEGRILGTGAGGGVERDIVGGFGRAMKRLWG